MDCRFSTGFVIDLSLQEGKSKGGAKGGKKVKFIIR
jgi:hypothetical protein